VASSRRTRRSRGGNRMKLDWVVNEDTYGREAAISLPAGQRAALPLTYPRFTVSQLIGGTAVLDRTGGAFPEGERQYVKAVVGMCGWNMSSWAVGNACRIIMRIVKKPMEWATALAIVDTNYDLNDSDWANERFAWQHVVDDVFGSANGYGTQVRVKANVRQYLEPDEALYLIVQNESGGGNTVSFRPMLRTLMKAEA